MTTAVAPGKNPAMAAPDDNKPKSPLALRIEQRLAELGTNATAVSLKLGNNKDLLRDILNGRTKNPRTDTLRRIADKLETTVDWLMEGDGMPPPPMMTERAASNFRMANVDLPARGDMPRDIPVMGTAAGSLGGAFQFEDEVVDYVTRPPALAKAKGIYALYIEGSSMVPEHKPGDLRFVHPHKHPSIGDTVVVTAKYSETGPYESFIKTLVRRTGDRIIVSQLNPPAQIEFEMRYVAHVHKVLTMNELFGI
jgi:phage repressor protein C with HTH and peptisase S24 domain